MKRWLFPAGVLALLAGLAIWWFAPAQVVKRRSRTLLQTLTLESGSGHGGRNLAGYTLNALLASEVELEAASIPQANGSFPRSEMESAFSWLCNQARQTRFEMEEFQSVSIEGDEADVAFLVNALVELPAYRPVDGRYAVVFHWRKGEDGWRLTSAQWTEAD